MIRLLIIGLITKWMSNDDADIDCISYSDKILRFIQMNMIYAGDLRTQSYDVENDKLNKQYNWGLNELDNGLH